MIFVTVGTNEARFDRLLSAVAEIRPDEDLVVQYGHSSRVGVARSEQFDFLPFDRMVELVREARVVVTHAGVGSIMVALSGGKRPVVVPRLRAFGEAVDDHQLQLGRRFAAKGLVTLVERPEELGGVLDNASAPLTVTSRSNALAADLRQFVVERALGSPAVGHA